jgi:hypothetical protein
MGLPWMWEPWRYQQRLSLLALIVLSWGDMGFTTKGISLIVDILKQL